MKLSDEERNEVASLLRYNANRFRLDALPGAWPDWMTPKKRLSMADNFERYALEFERPIGPGQG